MEIKILVDNNLYKNLETAWGLSIFIKFNDLKILFDTGPDPFILLRNSEKLKVNLKEIDFIVLSHDHLDHTGGISLFKNSGKEVYIPKGSYLKEELKDLGLNPIEIEDFKEIRNDIYILKIDFEQALIVNSDKGIILFTGCSHPGIEKFAKRIVEKFEKVYLIIGGFHYPSKSQIDFVAKYSERICPLHCSGERTRKYLKEKYPNKFILGGVGLELLI